jgi:2-polyprenyl-3-methyl-5-hydroxy-6-metoxy-1,4-benzoquinol methylase
MRRFPHLVELMDRADCNPALLNRTYRVFYVLNQLLGRWNFVAGKYIFSNAEKELPLTILDIGCGGGDVAERLLLLAKKRDIAVKITAIDPDERAIAFARAHRSPEIDFEQTELSAVAASGRLFDVVISNHVTHHVPDGALIPFLELSASVSRKIVLHNDIQRSFLAFVLYPFIGLLPGLFSFVLYDGLVSVLKSRTKEESRLLVPEKWNVEELHPFRLLLIHQS